MSFADHVLNVIVTRRMVGIGSPVFRVGVSISLVKPHVIAVRQVLVEIPFLVDSPISLTIIVIGIINYIRN